MTQGPAFLGQSDIANMIAGSDAITVANGDDSTQGLMDVPDEEAAEGELHGVVGRIVRVTIQTGTLPAALAGASVAVNGVAYRVAQRRADGDGALTVLLCVKP